LNGLQTLAAVTTALAGWWGLEARQLRLRRQAIPIRIHVNGTRGKSSVTRLIAGGLRGAGRSTLAKVTGTNPRVILPEGREVPVFRPAGAQLLEQLRMLRAAAERHVEALVLECMAVDPRLQAVSERRMIHATHGVITNARPDHLDVMGPTPRDVALALAGTVPRGGVLFTCEVQFLDVFGAVAAKNGSRMVAVTPAMVAEITPEDLAGFGHLEHPENVALALAVLADLGISRAVALAGMQAAPADEGALRILHLEAPDEFAPNQRASSRLYWTNAFAANDPESTLTVYDLACARAGAGCRVLLFNARVDRQARSQQMGALLPRFTGLSGVACMGEATAPFLRAARQAGWPDAKLHRLESSTPAGIEAEMARFAAALATTAPAGSDPSGRPDPLVVGVGNIGGLGLELWHHLSARALTEAAPETAP
jgi:poly-gamma-glutamate synthase PgsB/CapB